jgi:hypothetical protein
VLHNTLKEKLPIFLIITLILHIPLLALTDRQNDRRRNKYTCCMWAGRTESLFVAERKFIRELHNTLKEKLPIFLINTLLLHIPLLALTDRQNERRRNELTWRNRRLPSPTRINLSLCPSFCL